MRKSLGSIRFTASHRKDITLRDAIELIEINGVIGREFLLNLGNAIRVAADCVGHVMCARDVPRRVGEIFATHVVDVLHLGTS